MENIVYKMRRTKLQSWTVCCGNSKLCYHECCSREITIIAWGVSAWLIASKLGRKASPNLRKVDFVTLYHSKSILQKNSVSVKYTCLRDSELRPSMNWSTMTHWNLGGIAADCCGIFDIRIEKLGGRRCLRLAAEPLFSTCTSSETGLAPDKVGFRIGCVDVAEQNRFSVQSYKPLIGHHDQPKLSSPRIMTFQSPADPAHS